MGQIAGIEGEYAGLDFGDARLERRAVAIIKRAECAPAKSFPDLLPDAAELEGAYRFFQNEAVSAEELLRPHIEASLTRARRHDVVRIACDTTSISFGGSREGCGPLGAGGSGFWAHVALAVSGGEERAPLGIVGLETKVYPSVEERAERFEKARRKYIRENLRAFPAQKVVWPAIDKWTVLPSRLKGELRGTRVIHVMDREADSLPLLALLTRKKFHFVVRGGAEHVTGKIDGKPIHVGDELQKAEVIARRRVRLGVRPKAKGDRFQRAERDATLHLRAARVTIGSWEIKKLTINVVEVFEPRPPKDEEAVNWVLFTNEPIETKEDIEAIVDHYRARWRVEEFFKALKTGCSIEKRQLTTFEGLEKAVALFIPLAWHMLALRTAAQAEEQIPAAKVMSQLQMTVLRVLVAERKVVLDDNPTAREALFAVAALGGHLKRNGDPGWITIGRGYDRLRSAEDVWRLAMAQRERSDQS